MFIAVIIKDSVATSLVRDTGYLIQLEMVWVTLYKLYLKLVSLFTELGILVALTYVPYVNMYVTYVNMISGKWYMLGKY